MHLSFNKEMSAKAALTDDHVNAGVVEIESGRTTEESTGTDRKSFHSRYIQHNVQ